MGAEDDGAKASVAPEASRRFTVIHSDDVVETAEYYRDVFGFRFDRYPGEPPCFTILGRDSVEIFLSSLGVQGLACANRKAQPEVEWDAYIRLTDVGALRDELAGSAATIIRGPQVNLLSHARDRSGRLQRVCPLLR